MRVEVDRTMCEANGRCEELAPEVFALDDDDELVVLQEVLAGSALDGARGAVEACPRAALSLRSG